MYLIEQAGAGVMCYPVQNNRLFPSSLVHGMDLVAIHKLRPHWWWLSKSREVAWLQQWQGGEIVQDPVQRSAKVGAPRLVNFITAVAYHFYPSLPAAFTQPGASIFLPISVHFQDVIYGWSLGQEWRHRATRGASAWESGKGISLSPPSYTNLITEWTNMHGGKVNHVNLQSNKHFSASVMYRAMT